MRKFNFMPKPSRSEERLLRIVDAFPRVTVTVLGDMVADEFVYGEISRVSREAPVLILMHRERTIVPGGAANAVANLADIGVNVQPVGVVGDDEAGKQLLKQFRARRVPVSGVLKLKGRATVTKSRILAGMSHSARQQVVRVDREPESGLDKHVLRELVMDATDFARASDALLISDYGYGAASPAVWNAVRSRARLNGQPVTLDSRFRMLQFEGITAATPNEPEVEEALRRRIGSNGETLMGSGKSLLTRMKLDSLVITRGREGMVCFARGQKPVAIPIHGSDQVADVTGAGDTVIAVFTAALATGADAEDAARLANVAGGLVVMKRGTATVSADELSHALRHEGA
jgi:rfaE bifunctional protein kinase chain/domain